MFSKDRKSNMINSFNNSIKQTLITAFIFSFLFFSITKSFSQNVDNEVKLEVNKSKASWQTKDTLFALRYAQLAVDLAKDDNGITRAFASNQLADIYRFKNNFGESFDLYYSSYLLLFGEESNNDKVIQLEIIRSLTGIGFLFNNIGAWERALNSLKRLPDSYSPSFGNDYSKTKRIITECYIKKGKYEEAINTCNELLVNNLEVEFAYLRISDCYIEKLEFDKAIENENKIIVLFKKNNEKAKVQNSIIRIADWYGLRNNNKKAIEIYTELLENDKISKNQKNRIKYKLAEHYASTYKYTKSEKIIKDIVSNTDNLNNEFVIKAYNLWLMMPYFTGKPNQAYKRLQLHRSKIDNIKDDNLRLLIYRSAVTICESANKTNDAYLYYKKANKLNFRIHQNIHNEAISQSKLQLQVDLFSNKILDKRIKYEFEKQIEQRLNYKEGEQKAELRNDQLLRSRQIMAAFILFGLILFYVGYRTYRRRQKLLLEIEESHNLLSIKNKDIEQKSVELELKNKETQEALEQIRNMQDQLIESQRLASLGQVTAGIAHEIRNPLNFVTNFSTLIVELLDDLKEIVENKIELPPSEELDEVHEILRMINSNAEKIHTHGERASSIITNMLDVSRKNNNAYTSEPLNLLIKNSTQLAFEGAKGSMPGFDVNLKFDFDENINNVPIIKQDLSRVFINMVSNSCQAIEPKLEQNANYFGKIKITTKLIEDKVQIIITDNGTGISDKVMKNIFTPFFTTKDSGKGTGLGLTMTYDIITKLHKGKITVDSKDGEFTSFIIEIPTNLKS